MAKGKQGRKRPDVGMSQTDVARALDAAMAAVRARRFAVAKRLADEVLEERRRNPTALYILGVIAHEDGRDAEAAERIQQALEINPQRVEFHAGLAQTLHALGRFDEALRSYEILLAQAPSSVPILNNIGNVQVLQGRFADAVATYRRALALQPTATAHDNLVMALLMQGEPDAAIAAADACLKQFGYDTRAMAYRALAMRERGDELSTQGVLGLHRFVHSEEVERFDGFANRATFHAALLAEVLAHPSLTYEPPSRTTRKGRQTGQLMRNPPLAVKSFEKAVRAAIDGYIARLPVDLHHPFTTHKPTSYHLNVWATVLSSGGHQDPHIHANAWLSGVYYAKLPPGVSAGSDGQDGWIEFGCNDHEIPSTRPPSVRRIEPREGLVVLFPSFLYHRTVPFTDDDTRISIAFDLIRGAGEAGELPAVTFLQSARP